MFVGLKTRHTGLLVMRSLSLIHRENTFQSQLTRTGRFSRPFGKYRDASTAGGGTRCRTT
jgi:hypothetical protein